MNHRIDMKNSRIEYNEFEPAYSFEKEDWSIEFILYTFGEQWDGNIKIIAPKAGTNHPIRWAKYDQKDQAFEACRTATFIWVEQYEKNYPGAHIPDWVRKVCKPITAQMELF